jgi:hypothetical protein
MRPFRAAFGSGGHRLQCSSRWDAASHPRHISGSVVSGFVGSASVVRPHVVDESDGDAAVILAGVEEFGVQQVDLPAGHPGTAQVVVCASAENPGKSRIALSDSSGIDIGMAKSEQEVSEGIVLAGGSMVDALRTDVEIVHATAKAVRENRKNAGGFQFLAAVSAAKVAFDADKAVEVPVGGGDPAIEPDAVVADMGVSTKEIEPWILNLILNLSSHLGERGESKRESGECKKKIASHGAPS